MLNFVAQSAGDTKTLRCKTKAYGAMLRANTAKFDLRCKAPKLANIWTLLQQNLRNFAYRYETASDEQLAKRVTKVPNAGRKRTENAASIR